VAEKGFERRGDAGRGLRMASRVVMRLRIDCSIFFLATS